MTNKEAIEILWQYDVNFEPHPAKEVMHAIDMAINALTVQPDSKESSFTRKELDTISRQDAIDALHTWFRDGFDEDKWWNSTHVLAAIEGVPSAQPDNRLSKIAELVEGTIDHFDLDDAMDLLYQIKDVLR